VDDSYDKKAMANIDVRDIERIVFNTEKVYGDVGPGTLMGKKPSIAMPEYVEEESYVNPPQVDSQSEYDDEERRYVRIPSIGNGRG
jgi:hypothetical protein